MKRCLQCDTAYDFTDPYCPNCGAANADANFHKTRGWRFLLWGLLFFVCGMPFGLVGGCTLFMVLANPLREDTVMFAVISAVMLAPAILLGWLAFRRRP